MGMMEDERGPYALCSFKFCDDADHTLYSYAQGPWIWSSSCHPLC